MPVRITRLSSGWRHGKEPTFIATYFSSFILTLAMMVPNGSLGSLPPALDPASSASIPDTGAVEEAVRELPLSITDYATAMAIKQNIDPERFKRLIACESQWKEDAAGDNGTSFGILQFKTPTFALFSKKYKRDDLSIDNPRHQIDLASLMIADGYLQHWKNCARKTGWTRHLQEIASR